MTSWINDLREKPLYFKRFGNKENDFRLMNLGMDFWSILWLIKVTLFINDNANGRFRKIISEITGNEDDLTDILETVQIFKNSIQDEYPRLKVCLKMPKGTSGKNVRFESTSSSCRKWYQDTIWLYRETNSNDLVF